MTDRDSRDTVTRFISLASSNRVAASEIDAGLDTIQAVRDFLDQLQAQFVAARIARYDDRNSP